MTEMAMSPADIQAVTNGNGRGGMFGGEGIWGFILVFFILAIAGNSFGLGGNNGAITRTDLADSFNFNSVDNELRQIGNGIAQSNFATSNEIRNLATAQAECCCNLRTGILENRYAAERNTCDVVNAIHSDGEATRALINANTMQELRDRLEQAEREKLQLYTQLGTKSAVAEVIGELRPCAKPAYITCSPYTTNTNCGGLYY